MRTEFLKAIKTVHSFSEMILHKKIGILGGVSPESTVSYYEYITREYVRRMGDFSYPEIIIYSVRFQEFVDLGRQERWDLLVRKIVTIFQALQKAGADFGLIAANTLHMVFERVSSQTPIPLVSIVNATAEAIRNESMTKVGLLGTKITMTRDFFKKNLEAQGISTLVPEKENQLLLNHVIYEELARGIIKTESKEKIIRIVEHMKQKGVEGVILGCTEIPLLLKEADCDIRLFNTAQIHAEKALNYAIS